MNKLVKASGIFLLCLSNPLSLIADEFMVIISDPVAVVPASLKVKVCYPPALGQCNINRKSGSVVIKDITNNQTYNKPVQVGLSEACTEELQINMTGGLATGFAPGASLISDPNTYVELTVTTYDNSGTPFTTNPTKYYKSSYQGKTLKFLASCNRKAATVSY